MVVVATAGHVDHGKSTLVRRLTGHDPDRLRAEKRRGLTLDLGFAATRIGEADVEFVDVPGHRRYVPTMLAGALTGLPVMFVVAADDGWAAQSEEHACALAAVGTPMVLPVVTRIDRARGQRAAAVGEDATFRLRELGLATCPPVRVSGRTGAGLQELARRLAGLATDTCWNAESSAAEGLWVDRVFTITGAGTVVTGTLARGRLVVGTTVDVAGSRAVIRRLEVFGQSRQEVVGPHRVAVNLRAVPRASLSRGDRLRGADCAAPGRVFDVRLGRCLDGTGREASLHIGTAAATVRIRPLGADYLRLTLADPRQVLPVEVGDRGLLRDPGRALVLAGVEILAVDPPPLARRGAAARRAGDLAGTLPPSGPDGAEPRGDPGRGAGLADMLEWFAHHPLQAPTRAQLQTWNIPVAELAEAERRGQIWRTGGVVLHPGLRSRMEEALTGLAEPFTVGDVTRALGITRRVAVPVLERLDADLVTRRDDDGRRRLRRRGRPTQAISRP